MDDWTGLVKGKTRGKLANVTSIIKVKEVNKKENKKRICLDNLDVI